MKDVKIIIITLASVMGMSIFNGRASECTNPKPEWVFYSCWDTATGMDKTALLDGTKWDEARAALYHGDPHQFISVVNGTPPGGPAGNAFKIRWPIPPEWPPTRPTIPVGCSPLSGTCQADCSGGIDAYVEKFFNKPPTFPILPNPFYMRVYFYSEDLRTWGGCGGRKFFLIKNSVNAGNGALYLYEADGDATRSKIIIKNQAYDGQDPGGWNHRTSEHLDGSYAWPGQESKGIVSPNTWYCIEFAHYRHATGGWFKAWLNGKLVINATAAAFDARGDAGSGYKTDAGNPPDWLHMPSFWNGGNLVEHNEYLMNFIVSSSYIGPYGGGDKLPDPPLNARIIPLIP